MLFILSGDIQIGKTRFLENLVFQLSKNNIAAYGVLAPGVWIDHGAAEAERYEKTGINNLLLPENRCIAFATKKNAKPDGSKAKISTSQSDNAQLAWAIDDCAIAQVNKHFDSIADKAKAFSLTNSAQSKNAILIVDELGRLELLHEQGLTSAMALLDQGPTALLPHAILVVRDYLCPHAIKRFESAWQSPCVVGPDEEFQKKILNLYRCSS